MNFVLLRCVPNATFMSQTETSPTRHHKNKYYEYNKYKLIFLFCIATGFNENKETIETASREGKLLPIYNVQTEEKKVAFTMNCACLQLLMGQN